MFHSVRSLMIRCPISDVQISISKPGADAVQPFYFPCILMTALIASNFTGTNIS